MKRLFFLLSVAAIVLSLGVSAFAQRPRISDPQPGTNEKPNTTGEQKKEDSNQTKPAQDNSSASQQTTATQPVQNVKVKYEGGVFGYRQKMDGFLFFDDVNSRLVFKDKQQKEMFSIPYDAVSSAFADTQSRRPTAATVIGSSVPYGLGLPALLIKKKYRYLTMQYNDTEVEVSGVTSFKVESKELLEQTLRTLAEKAKLIARGEIFIRRRTASKTTSTTPFAENR
jgi:hypothetical protein